MGNKQVIAEKIAKTDDDALLYEEFKQYIANKKKQAGETSSSGSYSQLTTMLRLQKDIIPKEDLIKAYMEELKKELIKNLLPEDKMDVSMTGSSNEDCLAGESQDPDMDEFSEDNIDHMVKKIEDAAKKAIK
ncbi:hypothetical protein M9H77_34866 [Catharanthus roseus]|uniref:Uncharacterized protein n=1 Tax=Catharanthus roseus TaxID=4058 RepID=A0ACB9ZME2_CATRO|nr:hypothetical protein M9H77_34866 [Catharanthus roseus]